MSYLISVFLFFFGNIALTAVIWLAFSKYSLLLKKLFWFINILMVPTAWLIGLLIAAYLESETFLIVAALLSFFPNLVLCLGTVLLLDKRYR